MPKKKSSGNKKKKKSKPRSQSRFFSNLIFFSSLFCLFLFLGWLALVYLPLGEFLPKAQKEGGSKPKPSIAKPEPTLTRAQRGQQLLLKTKKELSQNRSLFQDPPIFSDCSVDEHYRNCLELSLNSDTDFILAEKFIQDLWSREPVRVQKRALTNSQESLALVAEDGSHPLAEIILSPPEVQPGQKPSPIPLRKPRPKKARIAIVIDDLGEDEELALELAQLSAPIALSILPFRSKSKKILEIAHHYGKPALLHMPMEPISYPDSSPGPDALYCGMSKEEIKATLAKALDSLPGIIGMNNHMGSAFTTHSELMEPVLSELSRRGLFFLDSRTTNASVGYRLAQEMGLKSCVRKIFLDNLQDQEAISQKLEELCTRAKEEGSAIGIGHPYPETVLVLEKNLGQLSAKGCSLVSVEELCHD